MSDSNLTDVSDTIARLLTQLGLDVDNDPHLCDTPARFGELLLDRFRPAERTPLRPFPAETTSWGPVIIRDIPFHALCAHHIVPFFGFVHIAYQPDANLGGFGAFPKLVRELGRGPQLQERLASQVADAIWDDLSPKGVMIRIDARQMCMELTSDCGRSNTIVTAARGCFDGPNAAILSTQLFGPQHG